MPMPPVPAIRRILGFAAILSTFSMVGSRVMVMRFAGPPASMMAVFSACRQSADTRFARGCTLNTTVLPPAIMLMVLLMMVSVGLVVGVMEQITPKGAYSSSIRPASPLLASVVRHSGPGVLLITARCFSTLSS